MIKLNQFERIRFIVNYNPQNNQYEFNAAFLPFSPHDEGQFLNIGMQISTELAGDTSFEKLWGMLNEKTLVALEEKLGDYDFDD